MNESWENLVELWANTEKILYIISNKPGETPRYKFDINAKPISKELEIVLDYKNEQTKESAKKLLLEVQDNRYYGINLRSSNTTNNDRSTIEFRLSNGTLDADTWIENINLFGGIIKAAQDIAIIQTKSDQERTDEERDLLGKFEKLKETNVNEQEKLEILLALVIPQEDREIYRERYEVNSKLLEENLEVKEKITSNLAEGPIDIRKIGRKVFLGEDGITGQEYRDGVRIIEEAFRENVLEENK